MSLHPRLQVPGTSVSFEPCMPLERAISFVGYENEESRLSVVVVEFPAPDTKAVETMAQSLAAEIIRSQRIDIHYSTDLELEEQRGRLIVGTEQQGATRFERWVLLVPMESRLAEVQVAIPAGKPPALGRAIADMLRSVRVEPRQSSVEHAYELTFPQGWTLCGKLFGGELYSDSKMCPVPRGFAYVLVWDMHMRVDAESRDEYVEARNLEREHYSDCRVLESDNRVIGGYPANISYVSANDDERRRRVILQHCYVFAPETTYLIASQRDRAMTDEAFERIVGTFRLRAERHAERTAAGQQR